MAHSAIGYCRSRRIDDVLDACGSPRSRSDWCTAARWRNCPAIAAHCLADKAELAHPDIRFSSERMYVEGRALVWEEPMQRRSKLVVLVIFTFAAMLFGLGRVVKPAQAQAQPRPPARIRASGALLA
jgi:hypothetical protein